MKRTLQLVASLIVGALLLLAVLRRFDLRQTGAALRAAHPSLLMLGLALMIAAYLLRGVRWRIWESSLSYWDSLRLILIGFMGNNILPARLGEILRAHCAAAKTQSDRGRTAALASISAERILDGLVLSIFGLIGIAIVPVDRRLRWSLLLGSLAFAVLAFALMVSVRLHERIRPWITAANRIFPGHVTKFASKTTNHFLNGLLPLGTWTRAMGAIAVSVVIWSLEVWFYYFVGLAVWGGMSLRIALLFLVVVNFASLIPFTMGGIGTIEAVAVAFLVSSGVPSALALAMVLLQHSMQYLMTTLSGGVLYLTGGFYRIPLARPKADGGKAIAPPASLQAIAETYLGIDQLREVVELKPAPHGDINLSIVIPAYNEQARLPRTVLETIRWCTAQQLSFELILVDDGSRDETLTLARLFEESDVRIRALACPHSGKGAAVRMGILNAKGRFVLFMDADGATPLAEIPKLLAAVEAGNEVAIGSRVMQSPGEVKVKTSLHRRFIGRVFAFFVNLFAVEGIADTQCGFKMFRRDAARAIFSRQKVVGFAFDVEILFLAKRLSLTVAEIPVNWTAQPGSTVNLVTDSIKMLWDISHVRWLHRSLRAALPAARQFQQPAEAGGDVTPAV